MNMSFSIGDTARMTGVSEKQLRNWEQRGYIQNIQRVISGERGYRRYSEAQVQQIKAIKGMLDQGFTLPVAAEKSLQISEKEAK